MNLLNGLSVGFRVLKALAALRNDVQSLPVQRQETLHQRLELEALDNRISHLESLIGEQTAVIRALQSSTGDTLNVMEAIAHRVKFIFWLAVAACCFATIAMILIFALR